MALQHGTSRVQLETQIFAVDCFVSHDTHAGFRIKFPNQWNSVYRTFPSIRPAVNCRHSHLSHFIRLPVSIFLEGDQPRTTCTQASAFWWVSRGHQHLCPQSFLCIPVTDNSCPDTCDKCYLHAGTVWWNACLGSGHTKGRPGSSASASQQCSVTLRSATRGWNS